MPELIGHIGAQVGKVLDVPKRVRMAAEGGGLVCLVLDRRGGWCGGEAEEELARFEVPIVDRDFDEDHFYWLVKKSQAEWAEYLLLRAGAPLLSVVNPRNAEWAAGKGRVPAWEENADRRTKRIRPRQIAGRRPPAARKRARPQGALGRLWGWLWDG